MDNPNQPAAQLFFIRNKYGPQFTAQKIALIQSLQSQTTKNGKALQRYHDSLLFLIAFPDNKEVYQLAQSALHKLEASIQTSASTQAKLFNTGITGSEICGAFSFEMAKWLRHTYKENVTLDSIFADDSQITSILSVVMPQAQSEILQDANTNWKLWLKAIRPKNEELLDRLIALFGQTNILPEVKDELWTALGINLVVKPIYQERISSNLYNPYYHKSLIKHTSLEKHFKDVPVKINITNDEAEKIIECGRMVLVRHIREIDPVTFSEPGLISYYKLSRGLTIAFYKMVPRRRHPIDTYTSYVAFKNGLPVAYGGSWVLFDSCRMALNVFAAYRGGESMYICEQILNAHRHVYNIKRFTVDPYQIGKDNSDGIHSGAFWIYHKLGFRPINQKQFQIAETEAAKLETEKGYRSPTFILNKLADSKMGAVLSPNYKPVQFDAADLSIVYTTILKRNYQSNRKLAEDTCYKQLARLLKLTNIEGNSPIDYVLRNWCVFIMAQPTLLKDKALKATLRKALLLKATGNEAQYVKELQRSTPLRKLFDSLFTSFS